MSTAFWLKSASRYKLLSKSETLGYFQIYRDPETSELMRRKLESKLVEHNLRLVVSCVKKYVRKTGPRMLYRTEFVDLLQQGAIGLQRSVQLFEPSKGCQFSTYAVFWINQSISRYCMKHSSICNIPEGSIINASVFEKSKITGKELNFSSRSWREDPESMTKMVKAAQSDILAYSESRHKQLTAVESQFIDDDRTKTEFAPEIEHFMTEAGLNWTERLVLRNAFMAQWTDRQNASAVNLPTVKSLKECKDNAITKLSLWMEANFNAIIE